MRINLTAMVVALVLTTAVQAQDAGAQQAPEPLDRATFVSQMDAEFKRLDGDGNGMLVPDEIVASQRKAAQVEALRQNRQVFTQLDRNGDGLLEPEEFAALANPSAIPTDATLLMSQFDSDTDGVVTLVEYRISTQANFDRVDTDRDGVVTEMEMRAAGIRL